jgi:ribose 5-phosphate isomerase A
MTIFERALELIPNGSTIGLGSGRASTAFVKVLGSRVRQQSLNVRGVATSEATATLAKQFDIPLVTIDQAGILDATVDGADEVDRNLNLIKGYGRALVREKIVAASSRSLVILVDKGKLVDQLGQRGKLPVEVVPFAMALCLRRLSAIGCQPVLYLADGRPFVSDNGNYIIDCTVNPISDPDALESTIRAIPGVVGTGLFLRMANIVLVGHSADFTLIEEKRRNNA